MGYKTEYFQDFDKFKYDNMVKNETIPMVSYESYNFNFFEIKFDNGVKAFLFENFNMGEIFVNYCNIDKKVIKYLGKTEDINFRVIKESINRGDDFIEECFRLSDGKEYLLLLAPFDLSYENNE